MPSQIRNGTSSKARHDTSGFSVVELAVVVAIMAVVTGIAVPQIVNTLRMYQLNSAAGQVADKIKFSRFEAIRKNVGVTCLALSGSGSYTYGIGIDSGSGTSLDSTKPQYKLSGNVTLLSTVSSASSLPTALSVSAVTILSGNSSPQKIAFDSRGAVNFGASTGGATTVYVFYVGQSSTFTSDYRAVVVMPSGITQIWAGGATTSWHQVG